MGGGVSWLLEGWADYMALSVEHKKQRLSLGKVYQTKQSGHATVVKLLIKQGQALPLSDLVVMDRVTFSRLGLRSYPQSWALFYFLRHYGGGVYREGLDRYIKAIAGGKKGKAVFEKEIGPLETIEKEWRDYVRSIPTRRAR